VRYVQFPKKEITEISESASYGNFRNHTFFEVTELSEVSLPKFPILEV
jgi:hypothetical protein